MPNSRRANFRALLFCAACGLPAAALAAEEAEVDTPVSGVTVNASSSDRDQPLAAVTVSAADIARSVNAVTAEDALKYLPSVFIRRRHIGDTQAPMTTRTSGVGSSARSLIYADGVLLSALVGNNNSNASPRWGMVAPEEIEKVEVLYGPFSAAYAGNSIGAVVNITTKMPDQFTFTAKLVGATQGFSHYGAKDDYPTGEASVGVGDRRGDFAWRLDFNHIESQGQPLSYATVAQGATPSAAGRPVTGAVADLNRSGAPILILGQGGLERQAQDNAKLKLAWDVTPRLSLSYLVGYFGNDTRADAATYLRDAAGTPVYAGAVNIAGYTYAIAPSALSSGVYRLEEAHWMQAAKAGFRVNDAWRLEAVASLYDYAKDEQRSPTGALPDARSGGAGAIVDMSGTGWRTLDLTAVGRLGEAHRLTLGAHADLYALGNDRYATSDWRSGPRGALTASSRGKTQTQALWAEDIWTLAAPVDLTLGARWEQWRAYDGLNYSLAPALSIRQPKLEASRWSPKAALTWRPDDDWTLSARAGLAYRFPTVGELYQAVTTGTTLSVPNPDLAPEKAVSTELSAQRMFSRGSLRASVFTEDVTDALISQTGALPGFAQPVTFVQNVGRVASRGVELVGEARDVGVTGLDLSGSVTFLDAKIRRNAGFPAAVGKRLPQAPEWRATLVATYRATDRLTFSAAARYADRSYATLDNSDPVSHTYQGFDGYFVVDARATWRIDDHWSAAVGIDNLNDRDYFLFHPFPQRSVLAELKFVY
jgi:iron complex outermembrane receptor protein